MDWSEDYIIKFSDPPTAVTSQHAKKIALEGREKNCYDETFEECIPANVGKRK